MFSCFTFESGSIYLGDTEIQKKILEQWEAEKLRKA